MKACVICGARFKPYRPQSIYCSPKCGRAAVYRRETGRGPQPAPTGGFCAHCAAAFRASTRPGLTKVFCSKHCKEAARTPRRQRRKEAFEQRVDWTGSNLSQCYTKPAKVVQDDFRPTGETKTVEVAGVLVTLTCWRDREERVWTMDGLSTVGHDAGHIPA